jgi:hypothetical protein
MTDKVDRTIHHHTDFFKNRRKSDPIARQLVESLDSYKELSFLSTNFFPAHLIYLDEKLSKEQVIEFNKRLKFENYEKSEKLMITTEFKKVILSIKL